MDSAMRDLERIREDGDRGDPDGGNRVGLVALAGLVTTAIVLALGMRVRGRTDADADVDPLARLDRASALAAARTDRSAVPPDEPEVDPTELTFPTTLAADDRPEVAVALAAASAELRHPDPIPAVPRIARPFVPVAADDAAERLPAALPAAIAAGSRGALERAAPHDPMLLDALPEAPVGQSAPEGHDGEYTLQVISYDSPEGAHAFAAGLRARGHRAFVLRAEVEGRGTVYRVRIGPFSSMAEAAAYRRRFEETERMNTIIVRRR
jgi:cell division septation protein DedD